MDDRRDETLRKRDVSGSRVMEFVNQTIHLEPQVQLKLVKKIIKLENANQYIDRSAGIIELQASVYHEATQLLDPLPPPRPLTPEGHPQSKYMKKTNKGLILEAHVYQEATRLLDPLPPPRPLTPEVQLQSKYVKKINKGKTIGSMQIKLMMKKRQHQKGLPRSALKNVMVGYFHSLKNY